MKKYFFTKMVLVFLLTFQESGGMIPSSNLETKLTQLKDKLTTVHTELEALRNKLGLLKDILQPSPLLAPTPITLTISPQDTQAILAAPTCAVPGCMLPCWKDTSVPGEWYSPGHGREHRKLAIQNNYRPRCIVCKYLYQLGQVIEIRDCHKNGNLYSPTCSQTHNRKLQELRAQQPSLGQPSLHKISFATTQAMQHRPPIIINFYEKNQPYYEFTNFWDQHPMMIDGKQWPTVEHYFQAQKFIGPDNYLQEIIRLLATARDVFTAANGRTGTYKNQIRPDWNNINKDVMRKAIKEKFGQHQDLAKILKHTENSTLIEHTVNDNFWGDGGDGSGQNWLGKILMEIRATL